MTVLRDAALAYAAAGLAVFPLKPGSKFPFRGSHGSLDATTDATQIRAWWTQCANANIGLATGRGLVLLDIDGPDAAAALLDLQRAHEPLPPTAWMRTRRGWHGYFRTALPVANSASKLGPGLDVRGRGGYGLAPPSVHPSGCAYRWHDDTPPARAPAWLERLLMPQVPQRRPAVPAPTLSDRYCEAALRREVERVRTAIGGTINHTLNAAAFALGQLVGAGRLDESLVLEQLADAAASAVMAAGWTVNDHTNRRTIASGVASGRRQPRTRAVA